jgi:hypothetical protein
VFGGNSKLPERSRGSSLRSNRGGVFSDALQARRKIAQAVRLAVARQGQAELAEAWPPPWVNRVSTHRPSSSRPIRKRTTEAETNWRPPM